MILMRARQTDCLYSLEKEFYQIITYIRVTMLGDDKVCFAPSVAVNFRTSFSHAIQKMKSFIKTAGETQLFRISLDLYITKTELFSTSKIVQILEKPDLKYLSRDVAV